MVGFAASRELIAHSISTTSAIGIRDLAIAPDFTRSARSLACWLGRPSPSRSTVSFGRSRDVGCLPAGTGSVELSKGVMLDQNNVVGTLLSLVVANIRDPETLGRLSRLGEPARFNTTTRGRGRCVVGERQVILATTSGAGQTTDPVLSMNPRRSVGAQRLHDSVGLLGSTIVDTRRVCPTW